MAQLEVADHGNHNSQSNAEHERLAASQKCFESLSDNLYQRHPTLRPILNAIENRDFLDFHDPAEPKITINGPQFAAHEIKVGLRNLLGGQVECSPETKQERLHPKPVRTIANSYSSAADDIYNQ